MTDSKIQINIEVFKMMKEHIINKLYNSEEVHLIEKLSFEECFFEGLASFFSIEQIKFLTYFFNIKHDIGTEPNDMLIYHDRCEYILSEKCTPEEYEKWEDEGY